MEIVLNPELEKVVEDKVASGQYPTPADVVRAALQLLDERDQLYGARLQAVREEIAKGLNSGEPIPADAVLARLHARGKATTIPRG